MSKIKLLIAEGRIIFLAGILKALEKATNISVVSSCSSGKEAVNKALKLKPDVILLDANITEYDCAAVINAVNKQLTGTRIIIVNQRNAENKDVLSLLNLNADGYIVDDIDPLHLINHIQDVYNGGKVISPGMGSTLMEAYQALQKQTQVLSRTNLTKREIELLSLVSAGLSNHEISERLFISVNTVKAHISEIMKKLNASNRHHAAVIAAKEGIILG